MVKTLLLFLIIPIMGFSQVNITGKVINTADKKTVANASVFLSNSTVGTKTADDGSFNLSNVHSGQYDLVVSIIGYETHHQTININITGLKVQAIEITPKITQLSEVKIGAPDPQREHNLDIFIANFLGSSQNAKQCKVVNPEVLDINYETSNRTLNASCDDFLVIENNALGYIVKYQVNKFVKDYVKNSLYYAGPVLFEQMKGDNERESTWIKNREDAYKGSCMHFLRSVYANSLDNEGFRVLKLTRKLNPARPTDSLIRVKLRHFSRLLTTHPEWKDSAAYWRAKLLLPKAFDFLVKKPLSLNDFIKTPQTDNFLALQYTDYIYVIYTKKYISHNSGSFNPVTTTHPATVIILNTNYALFDSNGIFTDPSGITFDGEWGKNGVADILPVNYQPSK